MWVYIILPLNQEIRIDDLLRSCPALYFSERKRFKFWFKLSQQGLCGMCTWSKDSDPPRLSQSQRLLNAVSKACMHVAHPNGFCLLNHPLSQPTRNRITSELHLSHLDIFWKHYCCLPRPQTQQEGMFLHFSPEVFSGQTPTDNPDSHTWNTTQRWTRKANRCNEPKKPLSSCSTTLPSFSLF